MNDAAPQRPFRLVVGQRSGIPYRKTRSFTKCKGVLDAQTQLFKSNS